MDDKSVDDNLFVVTTQSDWYANVVEYLTTQQLLRKWPKEERRKVEVNSIHFAQIGHRLFRKGTDRLLKRSMSYVELFVMIVHVGGIFLANLPAKRFLEHDIYGLHCSKTYIII